MRKLLVLLVVALASTARAEVTGCELSVELRGAVVDGWLTERVTDPTNVDEVTLPAGAQLIDVRAGAARAVSVTSAYAQEPVQGSGQCDTTGLDENEAFAKKHGFTGTPVLVRADGAVLEGYRPRAALIAWLKGDAS